MFFPSEAEKAVSLLQLFKEIGLRLAFMLTEQITRSIILENGAWMTRIGSGVNNAQKSPSESEQLKETVKTKVDQVSGQTNHL